MSTLLVGSVVVTAQRWGAHPAALLLFLVTATAWLAFSLPFAACVVLGGLALGPGAGLLLNALAVALGSSAAYFLAHRFGGRRLERYRELRFGPLIPRLRGISLLGLLCLRLIPFMPFGPITYAAGIARVPFRRFLAGTLLGVAPQTILYTLLAARYAAGGARAAAARDVTLGIGAAGAVVAAGTLAALGFLRRLRDRERGRADLAS